MEAIHYPKLGETLYQTTLENGLPVVVLPRPGFTRRLAYFVTDFGALHRQFTLDGQEFNAPAGVAHFLEHKLFDMPDRDVMSQFAALGASVNAFTSYDLTAYYFSCTDRFDENLQLLLEFVSTPYFTKESVEKEQGIIGQEIGMSRDTPDSLVFENLMQAMYPVHPIHTPILGGTEDIAQITPEILHACHQAFYRPKNMLLCVIGDVDPEQVVSLAQKVLPKTDNAQVSALRQWTENMTVSRSFIKKEAEVAMPMFQLGFKCEPTGRGAEAVRQEIVGDLAAEALFGESSALYLQLYQQGLIDNSFGGGFESVDNMAMLCVGGDSRDPEAVRDAILQGAQDLLQTGISPEDFLRMKRSALGRRIRDLDSFDSTAFRLCAYLLNGFDYFRFPELYQSIQAEELLELIRRVVTQPRCSLSVIYPAKEEEK